MGLLAWLGITANGRPLDIGDVVPHVLSRNEQGEAVQLDALFHEGLTLVYFYPKANTPGCTAQACSLRDEFQALHDQGVHVIGVSSDKPADQWHFKNRYHLPFLLLADYDRAVARAFGVRLMLGMPHRQSFLIKDGRVVWRDLKASTHEQARDVLKILKTLK